MLNISKKQQLFINGFFYFFIICILVLPVVSLAQTNNPPQPTGAGGNNPPAGKIQNPFKDDTIEGFIKSVVNDILLPIGGVIAVMMIIYAGFKYVTAGGDTTKIAAAHQALLYSVIGAAILLGAWIITNAISGTINDLRKP